MKLFIIVISYYLNFIMIKMDRTYTYIAKNSKEGMVVEKINGKIIEINTGYAPPVCLTCFHTEGIYSFCNHR